MSLTTTPHLNFRGNAREALEFYHSVFGGQLLIVTNEEAHSTERPEEAGQVKFGQVTGPDGFQVMAYDVPVGTPFEPGEKPFFVSVRGESAEEIAGLWAGLAAGAAVAAELAPSDFSPAYGMLTDRYGVTWVLDVAVAYDPA